MKEKDDKFSETATQHKALIFSSYKNIYKLKENTYMSVEILIMHKTSCY